MRRNWIDDESEEKNRCVYSILDMVCSSIDILGVLMIFTIVYGK